MSEKPTEEVKAAEGSGTSENLEAKVNELTAQLDSLNAELAKERQIKEELIEKRNERNKKHSSLKEEKTGLESQLQELQDKFAELRADHEKVREEYARAQEYVTIEKQRKKEALDSVLEMIPEDKRSLLDDAIPAEKVEKRLEYIQKHADFLLGKKTQEVNPAFLVHKPIVKKTTSVSLTEAERAFIQSKNRNMPESVAIEMKKRDPAYWKKLMEK